VCVCLCVCVYVVERGLGERDRGGLCGCARALWVRGCTEVGVGVNG